MKTYSFDISKKVSIKTIKLIMCDAAINEKTHHQNDDM